MSWTKLSPRPHSEFHVHKALFTCALHFSVTTKYTHNLPGVDCLSVLPTPSCPNLAKSVLELPKQPAIVIVLLKLLSAQEAEQERALASLLLSGLACPLPSRPLASPELQLCLTSALPSTVSFLALAASLPLLLRPCSLTSFFSASLRTFSFQPVGFSLQSAVCFPVCCHFSCLTF